MVFGRAMANCDCDVILPAESHWEQHYSNCKLKWNNGKHPLNSDGTIALPNNHLKNIECDILYHLGMDTNSYDLPKLFGDVKFICMGGTKYRMREFAEHISTILPEYKVQGKLVNLSKHSHRYAMYKVGPVLSVNHGIGIPSMTVVLQEVIKLLAYAKAVNPVIFRIGTCGGLDLPPGSVVISSHGINGALEKSYDLPVLGKIKKYSTNFDKRIYQEVQTMSLDTDDFSTHIGITMAADDFYRGQGRIDGPFCEHSEEDKYHFLKKLNAMGVKNIEMEATAFAAMTSEAGLRAADVCVTLIDRLLGDQVSSSKQDILRWQKRPMYIVGRYIEKYCNKK